MSARRKVVVALLALSIGPAAESRAQKLDKDSKKWLEEVKPIILPDEEKTFKELKDKGDREEFQKIFWGRRDPDLETPENEFQAAYTKAKAEADPQYKVAGKPGSETDCGRVYILLGKPDDVKKETNTGESASFRSPETWTYKDRPGQTFTGGEAKIAFDGSCQLPQGARLSEQLLRVAESKVLHPNLGYKKTADGKLTKLVDQLPKPSPAQTLLKTPRTDFPLAAEPSLTLKTEDGATYVAGLLRGDGTGLTTVDVGGKKAVKIVVAAQAVDSGGKVAATSERNVSAELGPDQSFLASFGMALKPGDYTLTVAALDPASGKGSTAALPFKNPGLSTEEMAISPLILLQDFQEGKTRDPEDPLVDFSMAPGRLVPRFGNAFTKSDTLTVLAQIYSAKPDETTGKPNVTSSYTILKDGKPVAKAEDQAGMMAAVGPVPLSSYGPGKYVVQLKVKDNVAQKEQVKEATFEIKP